MDLGDTVSLPPNFVPLSSEDGDNVIKDPSKVYIRPLAQIEFPSLDIPQGSGIERSQYFSDAVRFYKQYDEYLGKRKTRLKDFHRELLDLQYLTEMEVVQILGLDIGGSRVVSSSALDVLKAELPSITQRNLTTDQLKKLGNILDRYCS